MPNANVTIVSPMPSSTHPKALTIALDYVYPTGLALPAYLFVRCKDSPTDVVYYMHTITQNYNPPEAHTTAVNHTSPDSQLVVEVEARIVSSPSWDGSCGASSLADEVTLTDSPPITFPPPPPMKEARIKLPRGFLAGDLLNDIFFGINKQGELEQEVVIQNFDDAKQRVVFALHPHDFAKNSRDRVLRKKGARVLTSEVTYENGKWKVKVPAGQLKKVRALVVTVFDKNDDTEFHSASLPLRRPDK